VTSRSQTRTLLTCGIVAGPLYMIVGLMQIAIRPGFDIRRHPLSLLSNGALGWIQISNFLITGALLAAGAVGLGQALQSGRGRIWAPRMLGLYGLGLIGAGIFSADPALGFPPGTPVDQQAISWHGLMHFVVGTFGFAGFVATCFILARRFTDLGLTGWSRYSSITGVLFLAAFIGIASGSGGASPYFALGVALGFVWLSAVLSRVKASVVN
jgi:hypothetical protein